LKRTAIQYNVLTGSLSMLNKPDSHFTDPATPNFKKSPRWYTKESDPSFYDPYILVSGPHNRNKDVPADISIGNDTTVFGDSGGFQIAMEKMSEKEWNRKIALEWSEKNANIFPILDHPVAGPGGSKLKEKGCIEYSAKSAKYYADNRTRNDRQILNVLSANRVSNMQRWYDGIKEFPFDGWALGSHSNHLKTVLSGIIFLVSNKEFDTSAPRPLHVFGTTSMGVVPYIVYAQHLLNEMGINIQLSFDSSSASAMVNYGNFIQFCTPTAMVITSVSNKYDWTKLDKNSRFGCTCPICRDVDDLAYIFSDEGKGQFYTIIALHNFYQMLSYKRTFEGIISLNCQGVLDSLSLEVKRNFLVMKKAFSIMGEGGLSIIENGINTRTKKNPLDRSSSSAELANIINA